MEVVIAEINKEVFEINAKVDIFNINLEKLKIKESEIIIKKCEIQQIEDLIKQFISSIKVKVSEYNNFEYQKEFIIGKMEINWIEMKEKSKDIQKKIAEIRNNSHENQMSHEYEIYLLKLEKSLIQNQKKILKYRFMKTKVQKKMI